MVKKRKPMMCARCDLQAVWRRDRCRACATYLDRHGVERPADLIRNAWELRVQKLRQVH